MVTNPNTYSRFTTGASLGQIKDGLDSPHTGIIKSLSIGLGSNYPINGFNITVNSSSSIDVASGNILRNGALVSVSATGSPLLLTATDNTYHLVVVNSSDAIVLRTAGAINEVPDYTSGDIIIAVAKYEGGSDPHLQYLTLDKTSNSLSIGYDSSGYTEAGTITGNANGILITGTSDVSLDGANDRVYVKDATNNTLKTVTPQSIADLASGYTDGEAVAAIEAESGLDFSTVSSDAIIENTTLDKDIIFKVNDGGVSTEVMRIDGDVSRVGIGTNAPDSTLHIRGSSNPTVRIQEDSQTGYLDLSGIQDSQASISAVNDSASEVSILDITAKCNSSTGTGQEVRIFRDARTTTDGTFTLKQPGTNTNAFKFQCDKDGTDHQFIADGDVKIGGTSSPTVALDVTGEFRLSSHAELNGDLDHDGTNIGFFGTAPAAQQSVGNLGASGIQPKPAPDPTNEPGLHPLVDAYVGSLENEINTLRTKLDTLIDALQLYGIVT